MQIIGQRLPYCIKNAFMEDFSRDSYTKCRTHWRKTLKILHSHHAQTPLVMNLRTSAHASCPHIYLRYSILILVDTYHYCWWFVIFCNCKIPIYDDESLIFCFNYLFFKKFLFPENIAVKRLSVYKSEFVNKMFKTFHFALKFSWNR